jgi:protocatechuate 3,4-dioxygenase beta subunit
MRWNLRIVAALMVAGSVGVVGGPGAAQAARTLEVTPATGLLHGDVVALHGTGFTPAATVYFCQGVVEGTAGPEDCGGAIQTAQADDAGEFTASYTVQRFMSPSVVGSTIDCAQPSAACAIGASDFFAPSSGAAFAPLTFTAQPPRTLTVTPAAGLVDGDVVAVHGTSFVPADTVTVCQGSGTLCLAPAETVQADAAGEFSVDYTVQRLVQLSGVTSIDCAAPTASCSMLSVPGTGGAAVPLAFAPQPPLPQISGIVTDAGGQPVPGVDVWAYAPTDSWVGSRQAVTDAQGSFEIAQVEPDVQYRVLFRPPAGSPLAPEWWRDQLTRQNAGAIMMPAANIWKVHGQLDEAGAITGSVTDTNGNPVPGVQVSAFGSRDTWVASHVASTASDGTYRIDGVRPPETGAGYRVLFSPPAGSGLGTEWFDDADGRTLATEVAVAGGQTLGGVDAELAQTGAISGTVTDAGGNPVPGVQVSAYAPGDTWVGTHTVSTGADGTYRIDAVRPAAYRVRFVPPFSSGLVPEWFEDATHRAQATDVNVSSGQVAAVDAQLARP